jgi:exosortase
MGMRLPGTAVEWSSLMHTVQTINTRWLLYGLWTATSIVFFWQPLTELVHFAIANDNASHVVLIPFLSAWVLFYERKQIFRSSSYDFPAACAPLFLAIFLDAWAFWSAANWSLVHRLTVYTLALVLVWIAGFAFFFGRVALNSRRFPFLFLLLTVPLPEFLSNHVIFFLQKASTELTAALFDLLSVPYLREGFVFHLAHVNIEVAHECSGIRSSMALFILGLLVGHFVLRAFWRQSAFLVFGIFVMIVKNAVRIVTLTLLASYVDPQFLYGNLHREGGVVFFMLALLMLLPILWLFQRGERPRRGSAGLPTAKVPEKTHSA